jgi:hypothetical protein
MLIKYASPPSTLHTTTYSGPTENRALVSIRVDEYMRVCPMRMPPDINKNVNLSLDNVHCISCH